MKKIFETFEDYINESAFKRVIRYFKVDDPRDAKISIKEVGEKKYPWGKGRIFLVKVDKYHFYFEAFDYSSDTENQLLRTIGNIIDEDKNKNENPDFVKNSWKTKNINENRIIDIFRESPYFEQIKDILSKSKDYVEFRSNMDNFFASIDTGNSAKYARILDKLMGDLGIIDKLKNEPAWKSEEAIIKRIYLNKKNINESKIANIAIEIAEVLEDADLDDIEGTAAQIAKVLPIRMKQSLLREKISDVLIEYKDKVDTEELANQIVYKIF